MVASPDCGSSMQRSLMPLWKARDRVGAIRALDRGEVDEGAVIEPQAQIAYTLRSLGLDLLEHPLDQAHVLLRLLRPDFITHQRLFHLIASFGCLLACPGR